MTAVPPVADLSSYLAGNGWDRLPERWRGAEVWTRGDSQVLVPGRDDLGDSDLRVREALDVLAAAEQRPREAIARDVLSPLADVQYFRTFPTDQPSGFISLTAGLKVVHTVHDLLGATARVLIASPLVPKSGITAEELLDSVALGPSLPGSYVLTVRVPVDQPLGRQLGERLYDAVQAVHGAVSDGAQPPAGDVSDAVASADLCAALSGLAGADHTWPFDITFRWAHGRAAQRPAETVGFAAGAGVQLAEMADRMRARDRVANATVTGVVVDLHDEQTGRDRWRVRVRGDVRTPQRHRNRRIIWVRLPDQRTYDQALAAHRAQDRVRARGTLSDHERLPELFAQEFDVLD